jgi:hypothetical protein
MRFAFASSVLAAVVAAKTKSPVQHLIDTEDVCRRTPPDISFEWDDHDVWGWWYEIQDEYAASDAEFYALWMQW